MPWQVLNAVTLCSIVLVALTGCDSANGANARKPIQRAETQAEPLLVTPAPPPLGEIDRNALEMARRACENRDFHGLFTAMAVSGAVRRKYSAASITVSVLDAHGKVLSTRNVPSAGYEDFPVMQVDYYYKPARPLKPDDEDEYLDLQFNQSQNDDFSVDWARVHYDGKSEGGDDLGNVIGPDGKPLPRGAHPDADGQLLFRPIGNCWQLGGDIRWRW